MMADIFVTYSHDSALQACWLDALATCYRKHGRDCQFWMNVTNQWALTNPGAITMIKIIMFFGSVPDGKKKQQKQITFQQNL